MAEKYSEDRKLDEIDLKLLALLSENGRAGSKELAAKVGLTVTPTFERIKRLERTKVIQGYKAIINPEAVDKGLMIFCYVSLKEHNADLIQEFENSIVHLEEATECFHVAGDYDYTLTIEVKDIQQYQEFLKTKLAAIPNIANVQSSFVLGRVEK